MPVLGTIQWHFPTSLLNLPAATPALSQNAACPDRLHILWADSARQDFPLTSP